MRNLIHSVFLLAAANAVSGTGVSGGKVAQTNCEFDCIDRISLMNSPSVKDVCAELYTFLSADYQSCKNTVNDVEATQGGTPGRTESDKYSSWCIALCGSSTPPVPKKTCVQTCVDQYIGGPLSSGQFCFDNGKTGPDYFDCTSTLFAIDLANPWFALDKQSRLEAWCSAIACEVTPAPSTFPPTSSPTTLPTTSPTAPPTIATTNSPTQSPTISSTESPTISSTESSTISSTESPTISSTQSPTRSPNKSPTVSRTNAPTAADTNAPTAGSVPTKAPTNTTTNVDTPKGPYPGVRQSSCVNECANYWVNQPNIRLGSFCDFSGWKGSFLDACVLELRKMDVTKKNTKKKFAKAWCRLIACKYNPL